MYTIVRTLLVLAFTAWGVSIANIIASVMHRRKSGTYNDGAITR